MVVECVVTAYSMLWLWNVLSLHRICYGCGMCCHCIQYVMVVECVVTAYSMLWLWNVLSLHTVCYGCGMCCHCI